MKTPLLVIATLLVIASPMCAQQTTPRCELVDVQYSVEQEASRLVFTFSEPVRFIENQLSNNQLGLMFANTVTTKYANRVPLIFKSGSAKSLSFDFSRADSVSVIIALSNNVTYDVRDLKESLQVVIEMHPSDTAAVIAPVINIKALAQQQVEEQKMVATPEVMAAVNYFDVEPVSFAAACFVSLLGTAVMMYWLTKTNTETPPRRKPALRVSKKPVSKQEANVDAILAQAQLILREKTAVAMPPFKPQLKMERSSVELESPGLMLGKRFGRGQGAVQLAKHYELRNSQYPWEKKLQELDTDRMGKESIAKAKKLGIGRGEINLAASLQRMQETYTQKERQS